MLVDPAHDGAEADGEAEREPLREAAALLFEAVGDHFAAHVDLWLTFGNRGPIFLLMKTPTVTAAEIAVIETRMGRAITAEEIAAIVADREYTAALAEELDVCDLSAQGPL